MKGISKTTVNQKTTLTSVERIKFTKEQLKTTYFTIDISLNTEIFDSVKDFKNRNDILFAFEKEYLRSTPKNIFFRIWVDSKVVWAHIGALWTGNLTLI